MPKTLTLHDVDTQMAELLAQKAILERQAAALLVPLYGDIIERLTSTETHDLLVAVNLFQDKLADGMAKQQLGHVVSVVRDVGTFFAAEKERLMALTAEPAAISPPEEL